MKVGWACRIGNEQVACQRMTLPWHACIRMINIQHSAKGDLRRGSKTKKWKIRAQKYPNKSPKVIVSRVRLKVNRQPQSHHSDLQLCMNLNCFTLGTH